jgi:hypothetical protein
MAIQNPVDEEFSKHMMTLFREYHKRCCLGLKEEDPEHNSWVVFMIELFHEDWKEGKISDREFAHLVDNALCY